MPVIHLDNIQYVTLYTGNNGSQFCTCKCPCCSQKGRELHYQGTMSQCHELLDRLPNLEQLYLFGNPDVTVDYNFCHEIMLEAIARGIHVCFSTSGVGGKFVLTQLLDQIPTDMVDYVSFSYDCITKQGMSFAKGIPYPMEKSLEGLDWVVAAGYTVKVQPTLWYFNYQQTGEIIKFFHERGVNWFTFHVGSLESKISLPTHQHLTPEQIQEVHSQISNAVQSFNNVKVRCPIVYASNTSDDNDKWYCMHPERTKELLVMFTDSGIKATHVPMASLYQTDLTFTIGESKTYNVPAIPTNEVCPLSTNLSGRPDTCCRYISKYWNY